MKEAALLLLGGAVVVALASNVQRKVDTQLELRTIRVRPGKVKFNGNRLAVEMIVSNPNSRDIVVRSVVGEVYMNGKKIGTVEMFQETIVKANSKTYIPLEVRFLALQLMEIYQQLVNEKIKIELGFTGTINVDNKAMPIVVQYKVL